MPNAAPKLERRFKAVIFDFDGVLVESTTLKTEAFRTLFADRPDRLEAILDLHRRHAGVDRLSKFEMIYRHVLRQPLTEATKRDLANRFARLVEDAVAVCPMVPGAADLLDALDGHISVAIVSATPQDELDRIVVRRDLDRFFDAVRGSPPGKTEAVHNVLAERGWDATRVLMIGDAAADLAAARANGVAFIGRLTSENAYDFPPDVPTVRDLTLLAASARGLYALDRRRVAAP